MLPGALHSKGWKKASLDLPRRNQGRGRGQKKGWEGNKAPAGAGRGTSS